MPDVDEPFWDIHLALQIIVRAGLLVGWSGAGVGLLCWRCLRSRVGGGQRGPNPALSSDQSIHELSGRGVGERAGPQATYRSWGPLSIKVVQKGRWAGVWSSVIERGIGSRCDGNHGRGCGYRGRRKGEGVAKRKAKQVSKKERLGRQES